MFKVKLIVDESYMELEREVNNFLSKEGLFIHEVNITHSDKKYMASILYGDQVISSAKRWDQDLLIPPVEVVPLKAEPPMEVTPGGTETPGNPFDLLSRGICLDRSKR